MDRDGTVVRDSGGGRKVVVYVLWGRVGEWWRWKSNIYGGFKKVYWVKRGDMDGGGMKNGD